jgi:radical SAM protein with 4Fe4S-binding SPASM domain
VADVVGGATVRAAARAAGLPASRVHTYLELLCGLGLGGFSRGRVAVEGYLPVMLRSQAEKGVMRRPGGTLTVELASRCLYACGFCASRTLNTRDACSCGVWSDGGEPLPLEQLVEAVETSHHAGIDHLVVRGGEPLLEGERLWALLDAAARLGMTCVLHSTGVPMDDRTARRLRRLPVRVVVMVAAADAEAFRRAVNRPDAFDRLSTAVRAMAGAGVPFSAKTPVSAPTVDEALRARDWALAGGASKVEFFWYGPPEWTPLECQRTMGPKAPADMAAGIESFVRNGQSQACFDHAFSILRDGRVVPCIGTRRALADLRQVDMATVLRQRSLEPSRRTARQEVAACRPCEFRLGCRGCLVRTREVTGSMESRHASCNYSPESATWAT